MVGGGKAENAEEDRRPLYAGAARL